MHILLVGGGTGGHFYPLIAIAESLRAMAPNTLELRYFGPNPYNQAELDRLSITYSNCPSGKHRRYFSLLNFFDPFLVLYGILVALVKLYIWYPDVVVSKGGYTSVPVVIAAWLLRIPILIHESDTLPGRANLFASHFASLVAISYKETERSFPHNKVILSGIPIRQSFFDVAKHDARTRLQIPQDEHVLLVIGGSLGSERINSLILDSLDELLPTFIILHQTGEANFNAVQSTATALLQDEKLMSRYRIYPTVPGVDLALMQSVATLIISRAGSTSIAEIALQGKPSILIPIPETISHDQKTNAYTYARTGAASVIEEENMSDGLLNAEITRILSDSSIYEDMAQSALKFARKDAGNVLAQEILTIATSHGYNE